MTVKIKQDILYVMAITVLYLLVSLLTSGGLRTAVGLPVAFLFPGYSVVSALFPRNRPIDGLGRLTLSLVFQFLLVPVVVYGLNFTPWGLSSFPVVALLSSLILSMCAVAYYRRRRAPVEQRFVLSVRLPAWAWPEARTWDRTLSVLVLVAILASIGAFAFAMFSPLSKEAFTEFSVLGNHGLAGEYNETVTAGQISSTTVMVSNRENATLSYEIEVRIDGAAQGVRIPTGEVVPGQTWEQQVTFIPNQTGLHKLQLVLYRDGEEQPYRQLHLWLNVAMSQ